MESIDYAFPQNLSQHDIRVLILMLLYAAESFDYKVSLESIAENLNRGLGINIPIDGLLFRRAASVIADREQLDKDIRPLLDKWKMERLGCMTLLIMRLALWELKNTDTAPSVILNEAIELAKEFAEQDAYKFVNGVLDKWVGEHKPAQEKS